MANYNKMMQVASLVVDHMKRQLDPGAHLQNRNHFGTEAEVKERMRRERMCVCSSFGDVLSEDELVKLIHDQLEIDVEKLYIENRGISPNGLSLYHGELVMLPLDADENQIETGFLLRWDRETREYTRKPTHKVCIYATWEEYENGSICAGTFSVDTVFPVR